MDQRPHRSDHTQALDNMSKFDQVYDSGIPDSRPLSRPLCSIAVQCGVLLVNGEFPNYRYQVSKNPFTDTTNATYRAIICLLCALAGCYARCNTDGCLEFRWFDTAAFDDTIDGGVTEQQRYHIRPALIWIAATLPTTPAEIMQTAVLLRRHCLTTISIALAAAQSALRT